MAASDKLRRAPIATVLTAGVSPLAGPIIQKETRAQDKFGRSTLAITDAAPIRSGKKDQLAELAILRTHLAANCGKAEQGQAQKGGRGASVRHCVPGPW